MSTDLETIKRQAIRDHLSAAGRKGGKAGRGEAKRRSQAASVAARKANRLRPGAT